MAFAGTSKYAIKYLGGSGFKTLKERFFIRCRKFQKKTLTKFELKTFNN